MADGFPSTKASAHCKAELRRSRMNLKLLGGWIPHVASPHPPSRLFFDTIFEGQLAATPVLHSLASATQVLDLVRFRGPVRTPSQGSLLPASRKSFDSAVIEVLDDPSLGRAREYCPRHDRAFHYKAGSCLPPEVSPRRATDLVHTLPSAGSFSGTDILLSSLLARATMTRNPPFPHPPICLIDADGGTHAGDAGAAGFLSRSLSVLGHHDRWRSKPREHVCPLCPKADE